MKKSIQLLENALKQLDIAYTEEMLLQFEKHMTLTLEWNEKVNLTSITNEEEFVVKHFIDSIVCADLPFVKNAKNIIDIGTGAGFPGLSLAILFPEKKFLLADSVNKKVKIVAEIATAMGLKNVRLIHGRAEDLGNQSQHREKYDLCVSRAVAKLSVLSEYCMPFVKVGGYFIAYKGKGVENELLEAEKAIFTLGGEIDRVVPFEIKDLMLEHQLICIKKDKKTPDKFPRTAGKPSKEPI
jgi:16S rRNA (guanine527-N7)-methyltransferase